MKQFDLGDWIQLLIGVFMLIGVGLVLYELRQSREIASAELIATQFNNLSDRSNVLLGETPAEVISKACHSPEEITDAEVVILDNYLNSLLRDVRSMYTLSKSTGFFGDAWQNLDGPFLVILSTYHGRAWWKQQAWIDPELRAFGESIAAEQADTPPSCDYYKQIHQNALELIRRDET